jgi:hypothetical protein
MKQPQNCGIITLIMTGRTTRRNCEYGKEQTQRGRNCMVHDGTR